MYRRAFRPKFFPSFPETKRKSTNLYYVSRIKLNTLGGVNFDVSGCCRSKQRFSTNRISSAVIARSVSVRRVVNKWRSIKSRGRDTVYLRNKPICRRSRRRLPTEVDTVTYFTRVNEINLTAPRIIVNAK